MSSTKAIFISDVHLGSTSEPKFILFLDFLKSLSAKNITHLFLMGDIFDLWVADQDYFIEKYKSVIFEIQKLKAQGVEIHFFEGNHDLHLTKFWQEELDLIVHKNATHIHLGEVKFRLEHGDEIDQEDKGYLFLRWFLRTPVMSFVAHSLPGAWIKWIGEKASHSSREYTTHTKSITESGAIEKIRKHAEHYLPKDNADYLISGHLHVRDDYTFKIKDKKYRSINLGTWLDKPCYLAFANDEFKWSELS